MRTYVRDLAGERVQPVPTRSRPAEPARAWSLAAELPQVALADALALLLLALDQQPWRFDSAAPRWHSRLCAEARLTLAEAQLAVAALDALPGPGAVAGGQALVGICDAHGLDDTVGVLDAWLSARN